MKKLVFSFLILLLLVRVSMPYVIEIYLERKLNEQTTNFKAEIDDVDLSFWRGALQIEGLYFFWNNKKDVVFSKFDFFEIDLNYWNSLLQLKVEAQAILINPTVVYEMSLKKSKDEKKSGAIKFKGNLYELRKGIRNLFPFELSTFKIHKGEVTYKVKEIPFEFKISSIELTAEDVTNDEAQDSQVKLNGLTTGGGTLEVNLEFDPQAESLQFDLDASLKKVNLKSLNPLFEEYASIDVASGTISTFLEVSAKDQKFLGYVKPIIKDLNIVSEKDLKQDSLPQIMWEGFAGLLGNIFENSSEDQLGAKVKIEGRLTRPDIDLWQTIESILTNAFVSALAPQLDWDFDFI